MADVAPDQPGPLQFATAGITTCLLAALALLVAPVASRHIHGVDAASVALIGGDLMMDVVIAIVLYSRGRIAGDADSIALGNLFLFAGGFFLVSGLVAAGNFIGWDIAPGSSGDRLLWLIWTGSWLCGVAVHAWTTDLTALRTPIKRQVGRAALATGVAALTTWGAGLLLGPFEVAGAATGTMSAAMAVLGVLAVAGWVGVTRRLARRSVAGLWLAVILLVEVANIGWWAFGAGPDTIGSYVGASALLLVKLLAFVSLFGGLVFRFMRLSETNSALDVLAHHDALTGLANRRRFDQLLLMEWRRCARDHMPLALVLMDVDKFKQFNDGYGHPAGDACLAAVAAALADHVRRPGDLAARYGGEEFALLLPGADTAGAVRLAEHVREALRDKGIPHDGSHLGIVTVSAGVACLVPTGHERQSARLLLAADQALYRAKAGGRDQVATESLLPGRNSAAAGAR